MVQTLKAQDAGMRAYVVLRAICIGGLRVEPGASIELSRIVGAELAAANKVALEGTPAADAAREAARSAAKAAKKAAKAPKPTDSADNTGDAAGDADTANAGAATDPNPEDSP